MKQLNQYFSLQEAVKQVGKGWTPLIQKVYNAREGIGTPVGIIGIKEKFGGLRIYTEYYEPELEKVIVEAGKESFHICPVCGEAGVLRKSNDRYFTACDTHAYGAKMVPKPWY